MSSRFSKARRLIAYFEKQDAKEPEVVPEKTTSRWRLRRRKREESEAAGRGAPSKASSPSAGSSSASLASSQRESKMVIAAPVVNEAPAATSPSDMPATSALEKMFDKLLDEWNMTDPVKRQEMQAFTPDRKWLMIQQQSARMSEASQHTPDICISNLQSAQFTKSNAEELRLSLTGGPISWLSDFIAKHGLLLFFGTFNALNRKQNKSEEELEVLTECVRCAKAMANTRVGLAAMIETRGSFEALANSLSFLSDRMTVDCLEIIAGLCLLSKEAHKEIYRCMEKKMQKWLDLLVLHGTLEELKVKIMTFFNALLAGFPDIKRSEVRANRNLDAIVSMLQTQQGVSTELLTQVEVYNRLTGGARAANAKEGNVHAEEDAVARMGKTICNQLRGFPELLPVFKDILEHLTLVVKDGKAGVVAWQLIDSFVQAVACSDRTDNCQVFCKNACLDLLQKYGVALDGVPSVPQGDGEVKPKAEGEAKEEKAGEDGAPAPPAEAAPPPPPPGAGPPPPPPPPGGAGGPPPPPPPPGAGPPGPPPPPGSGPPPPPGAGGPPPPPGGGPAAIPQKPVIKPAVKMRGLNWNRLNGRMVNNTIWEKLDDEAVLKKLDTKELETLFGQKPKAEKANDPEAAKKAAKKAKFVNLLDNKRSQNLAIMLSRFKKIELSELHRAILDVNTEVLTLDNAIALSSFAPESEETEMVKEYAATGDLAKLPRPELFILEVADVPRFKSRMSSLVTVQSFDAKFSGCQKDLDLLCRTLDEVKQSKKLEKFLEIVLAVGNYMNGSTRRGGAFGFRLATLGKLSDVKSTANPRETLLHYLIKLVEKDNPELLDLPSDFPSLADATRIGIDSTSQELMTELVPSVKQLEGEMTAVENGGGDEKFLTILKEFHGRAQPQIDGAKAQLNGVRDLFKDTLQLYGEDSKTTFQEFTVMLNVFLLKFSGTYNDIRMQREREAKRIAMAEAKAKRLAEAKAKKAAGGPSSLDQYDADVAAAEAAAAAALAEEEAEAAAAAAAARGEKLEKEEQPERGLLDQLINNMRSGDAFSADAAVSA